MKKKPTTSISCSTCLRLASAQRLILTIGVIGFALRHVPTASAEQPREVASDDDSTAHADRLYRQGVEAYKAHRYDEAREAFKAAYEVKPAVAVLRNLGAAEVRAGKFVDGARHLSEWLRTSKGTSADDTRLSEDLLHNAENQLTQLDITSSVDGAEISVDDEIVGKSPLGFRIHVDTGKHVVHARKGGLFAEQPITATAGSILEVNLNPKRPSPPSDSQKEKAKTRTVTTLPGPSSSIQHVSKQPEPTGVTPWDVLMFAGSGLGIAGSVLAIGAAVDEGNQRPGSSRVHRDRTLELAGAGLMVAGAAGYLSSTIAITIFRAPTSFVGRISVESHRADIVVGGNF